jgi:Tol biopolymer transport system component
MRFTNPMIWTVLLAVLAVVAIGCSSDDGGEPVIPPWTPVVHQITSDPAFQANPAYSPNGNWIVYEQEDLDDANDHDLWRMAPDGSQALQLTDGPEFDSAASWSADGTLIVFESNRSGSRKHLWTVESSGSGITVQLTNGAWDDGSPDWSPDNATIVFESNRDGSINLWLYDVVSGDTEQLTATSDTTATGALIYNRSAAWSPDSQQLVFESNRSGLSALYFLPVAGGTPEQITETPSYEGHPSWSPDGVEIAYESTRGGTMELYVIPAAGPDRTPFQVTIAGGYWPQWSANSESIVYGLWTTGDADIWTVEVDWR